MRHGHTNPANAGRRGDRWEKAKRAVFGLKGTNCWWCGHPRALEVDHLIRRVDGGDPYELDNLVPSHGSNYPCPVCINPKNGKPRCCNQARSGKQASGSRQVPQPTPYTVDATTI